MTQVDFHFNVPGRTAYVCRLLRKVVYSGYRVLVLLPAPEMDTLDTALWTFSQEDFIAHARHNAAHLARHAPVLLTTAMPEPPAAGLPPVLLNLMADVPAEFHRFDRVLEVVTTADEDRAQARQRWRAYAQHQIQPNRFDLSATAPA